MIKKRIKIPAGKFKATCLALLDEVAETGIELIVTKHGKPVARVVPLEDQEPPSLKGSILQDDDIISPIDTVWFATQ